MDPTELLTPEVRAFLASAAPAALPTVVRGIGRNLPLLILLALVGYVISKFVEKPSGLGAAPGEAPPAPADVAA